MRLTVPILALMEPTSIEEALAAAEAALASGSGLSGTGFGEAVAAVKSHPELAERHADRMAAIDLAAFGNWALIEVPIGLGTAIMVVASLAGVALVGAAYYTDGDLVTSVVFYAGLGILLVTTHGLAHLAVGRAVGIRFTHWFLGSWRKPQPGVKVDYASYLRAKPMARAWMHASGALLTKTIPLLLLGAAVAAGLPGWAVWGLVVVMLATILTDVLWSTSSSDWARFKRERRFAQPS